MTTGFVVDVWVPERFASPKLIDDSDPEVGYTTPNGDVFELYVDVENVGGLAVGDYVDVDGMMCRVVERFVSPMAWTSHALAVPRESRDAPTDGRELLVGEWLRNVRGDGE